jgi:hypothetical protein
MPFKALLALHGQPLALELGEGGLGRRLGRAGEGGDLALGLDLAGPTS